MRTAAPKISVGYPCCQAAVSSRFNWPLIQTSKSSTTKSSMPRNRRFSNLGIGGFRAKSTRVSQVKKSAMAAATNSNLDPSNAQYTIENFSTKQGRRRQMKKKSEIDENYPDYLMQAFLGSSLLAHSAEVIVYMCRGCHDDIPFPVCKEDRPGEVVSKQDAQCGTSGHAFLQQHGIQSKFKRGYVIFVYLLFMFP